MNYLMRKFQLFFEDRKAILYLLVIWEGLIGFSFATGKAPWGTGIVLLTLGPTLLCFMLFQHIGNPKYWWAPFFGTTVTINEMKLCKNGDEAQKLANDLQAWVKEMNIKGVYKENAFRYTFLRRKHAAMFKLAWG